MSIIGLDEALIFPLKHEVYPLIDPTPLFVSKPFTDRVVIITGASRGIGLATATAYARAGASLVLVARRTEVLEKAKAQVLAAAPGTRIELLAADVSSPSAGPDAVKRAAEAFGRLDVLVANAAVMLPVKDLIADKDPLKWWYTQEVNVRGTFTFIHAALPELLKTKGQIVVTTSGASLLRLPGGSDYNISKHTVDRLVEFIALEYPDIKAYSVHPGVVETDMYHVANVDMPPLDPPELPASVFLWLTARNAEFLSGRYLDSTWDLNEVLAVKDEIVEKNLLVKKLAGPTKA